MSFGSLHRFRTCGHEYRCAKCGKVEAKTFRLGPSETTTNANVDVTYTPSDLWAEEERTLRGLVDAELVPALKGALRAGALR